MTTTRPWRQEIELLQNYSKHDTFTLLSASGNAGLIELDLSLTMEECNKISLVVELGPAYITFDETATSSGMYVPQDEGYFDDSIWFGTKISIKRAAGTNVRIRGILWGR